ncbi:MAG TPA: Rne/Rng family ribonuclease [Rhizomicrobium sp.]|jgi:ribonuclease G|nr:Rne/Rng family ribonuclease [Rhizomicrobium sp.]
MKKEILINAGAGEIRTAVVEDGRLQELFVDRTLGVEQRAARRRGSLSGQSLIGNIILGRVQRVLSGMQAAFVDIGFDRAGFLGAREARCLADIPGFDWLNPLRAAGFRGPDPAVQVRTPAQNAGEERAPRISDCVREGDEVVVQVVKDPIGDKGARLSANVTLPGRLLVLVPNQQGVALSRRIDDETERARLAALCEQMLAEDQGRLAGGAGYIVRSAAIGAEFADLREDAERLAESWAPVVEKRARGRAPALLHQDLDPIERIMRDEVDAVTARVIVDDAEAMAAAGSYCRRAMPAAEAKLELFDGRGLLFDAYGLEDEIERLLGPRVPLPSGGWITIEGTEALTAIDVNSGSFTESTGLEETSLRVNLEAADEIGRQLRLRGIGGLIVIDFIHVSEAANIECILAQLTQSLAHDRTPTQISPMSEFGLVEITRKRTRDPLARLMTESCRACRGRGRARSVESVAMEILRAAEREGLTVPGRPIHIRAAPDVIYWLDCHGGELHDALARRHVPRVVFEPRSEFTREGFDVSAAP